MLSGGVGLETLYINDDTLWSGFSEKHDFKGNREDLNTARKLILEGRQDKADKLIEKNFTGDWSQGYLPLCKFKIFFESEKATNYKRKLNLCTSVADIEYETSDNRIKREAFVSYPDKVFVYKIKSEKPIDIKIASDCQLKSTIKVEDNSICVLGQAPESVAPNYIRYKPFPVRYNKMRGMAFCASMQVICNGSVEPNGKRLIIKSATEIVLYTVTSTGYKNYYTLPDTDKLKEREKCKAKLNLLNKDYDNLKSVHINDFSNLYTRLVFSLKYEENLEEMPTDTLLKQAKCGKISNGLYVLLYNFGRYLAISGSREGTQALNLQGIWNKDVRPPWSSNYTTNINLEMNYWPMATCNRFDFDS